ncbi:MAG TPA: hypothetical protein VLV89_09445, partial [Candidatus Acidoferrum sp.]|nr:hypothetical protein [Candidatus Acidoferrum sp.]
QQIKNHYDKMTDAQKKEFDSQANNILNHKFDDSIVFRVDYDKILRPAEDAIKKILPDASNCEYTFLTTEKGKRILPIKFVGSASNHMYDLTFPRLLDGQPVIADNEKSFSLQFQALTVEELARPVKVYFDTKAMRWKGNLSY